MVQRVEEFVDTFVEKLEIFSRHEFIAKQQSRYLKEKKEALQPGEVLVLLDFSENYSFDVQDAVPRILLDKQSGHLTAMCLLF